VIILNCDSTIEKYPLFSERRFLGDPHTPKFLAAVIGGKMLPKLVKSDMDVWSSVIPYNETSASECMRCAQVAPWCLHGEYDRAR
jgi:hypothetical protein